MRNLGCATMQFYVGCFTSSVSGLDLACRAWQRTGSMLTNSKYRQKSHPERFHCFSEQAGCLL